MITNGKLYLLTTFLFFLLSNSYAFQNAKDLLSFGDSLLNKQTPEDTTTEKKQPDQISLDRIIYSIEGHLINLNHISTVLRRNLDTTEISQNLPIVERTIRIVRERMEHQGAQINLRYLSALENLTDNLSSQVRSWKRTVDERNQDIQAVQDTLVSIKNDKVLQYSLGDTTQLPEFQKQITELRTRWNRADSLFRTKRLQTASYQSQLSRAIVEIDDFRDEIQERQRSLQRALFNKENNYLWESPQSTSDDKLYDILFRSLKINEVILRGYSLLNWPIHLIIISLGLLFYLWCLYLLRHIKTEKEFADIILHRANFIPKRPFFSALIAILPIAPFLYPSPPVVFIIQLLFLMVLATAILIHKVISKKLFLYWLAFVGVFTIYSISNLFVEIAFQERWVLFGLSIIGILLGRGTLHIIRNSPHSFPRYSALLVQLYIAMQALSLLANTLGRYSLSKIFGVAATISLMQAISLYVFVMVILESIYLQVEMSKKNKKEFTAYFDFQDIQEKLQKLFIGVALIIWLYYFTFNLSIFDYLSRHIIDFLSEPRSIGGNSFDFGSILIFILVVWISSFIAKYIAYFAEIKDQKRAGSRSQRLGSSVLLIKLAILSVGFLFAVTASGIPLDKVAIVLGALSVGIGFGLQTIVNNLVSGIILAFERPVQIGDAIEVGGRSGVVKEVGIRASKIQAYDGSEVILPNGDLLSQHLINWTLSDKKKRIELIIGVAYGSNADLVESIIQKILDQENDILKSPAPSIHLQNFADSAIEFRLLFWVNDFDIWLSIRNNVMKKIYKGFKNEGIEIPFPQRDLHIRSSTDLKVFPTPEKDPRKDDKKEKN